MGDPTSFSVPPQIMKTAYEASNIKIRVDLSPINPKKERQNHSQKPSPKRREAKFDVKAVKKEVKGKK